MGEFASLDRTIVSSSDALISALSSAVLYGKGVFTTVAIHNGVPFLWEKHWRRLTQNAARLVVDLSEHSEQTTKKALDDLIEANGIVNGRARITFFDERSSIIWPLGSERKTSLLILTRDLRPVPDNFRLTVSPHLVNSTSPLAGVKSCNYLEKIIALGEAKSRGFDEAIQLNERGFVTSAVMANVFWLRRSILYTPSLRTGCLPGTTREFVLENLECREVSTTVDELNEADAIFLTSAGLGVTQVAEFQSRKPATIKHPITNLLPERL